MRRSEKRRCLADTKADESRNAMEAQAQAALDSARDDATAAEWAFHNKMLGAKDQVRAQYGDNSDEYQAVGRTKGAERQCPGRVARRQCSPAHPLNSLGNSRR